jgi:hypothetical protein
MHQKKKIALEIAAKIASVNGPQQYHTPLATCLAMILLISQ